MSNAWGQSWGDAWSDSWGETAPVGPGSLVITQGMLGSQVVLQGYGEGVVAPVAQFVGAPLSGYEPLTVAFTDLSTDSPTSWLWDFGDGDTSTDQNPTHEYLTAGTYTVTLTVENAGGISEEIKTDYITISEVPAPTPTGAPSGLRESAGSDGGFIVPPQWISQSLPVKPWVDEMELARKRKRKKTLEIVALLELGDLI